MPPKKGSQFHPRRPNPGPWMKISLTGTCFSDHYTPQLTSLKSSYESGLLEDPDTTPPTDMWKLVVDPEKASDQPERFIVEFAKGIPVKLEYTENGNPKFATEPVELLTAANALARRNGVGRIDIVENRYVGIKSRGCVSTFSDCSASKLLCQEFRDVSWEERAICIAVCRS